MNRYTFVWNSSEYTKVFEANYHDYNSSGSLVYLFKGTTRIIVPTTFLYLEIETISNELTNGEVK
jgi:hypothetical protein